ncbi:MAG: hypothetical protein LBB72_03795 [Spirochaetaceae bacterium]|jgi:hypothetical protein|nr:hypothetical protein [Spirochaetaceae bacterium]
MRVTSLKSLIRKDVPIYYRRLYSGTLEIELINETVESNINFTMETKPTGISEVIINDMEHVDYPLLPLVKAVKQFITLLDENDGLPL